MITKENLEQFVYSQILDGEELTYVSRVGKPEIQWTKIGVGIFFVVALGVGAGMLPKGQLPWGPEERFMILAGGTLTMVMAFLLWSLIFYKRSTRRIVALTNLRFLIFEYERDLHRFKSEEELEEFESRREIPFERIDAMKLTQGADNSGVLAMVFEEENKNKNGYVQAKLHLEVDDCDAVRGAVPARLRPDATKGDYWERSYND
ncbi:MAG: hypothetical protein R3F51_11810 [Cyanobacteriota/Melainabacteria group bacterium]